MVTIKIHLLESRVTSTTYNDVSIESPNNYRIIEGEKNTTQFELVYDQNVWKDYTFKVEMVNSKGYSVEPPTITNNTFTLPNGMATAGYGYVGIKATKGNEVVTFMPVKVKVWDYVEAWKGNVIDRNITFQEFVELENRVEDLEQNGTGGGSVANAVTTDTAQTITGEKTFTMPVQTNAAMEEGGLLRVYNDGLERTNSLDETCWLSLPFEDGILATQEYVDEAVANAGGGGGSSADVGEIQICCATNFSLGSTQSGRVSIVLSHNTIIGTPIVGGYVLCRNGLAIIDEINDITMIVTPITMYGIQLNGKLAYNSNFYAPTTAGTSGYVLTSSGKSGEPPIWVSPDTIGGGSSGNANIFYVKGDASNELIFTLYGNASLSEIDWSTSGATGISTTLLNYAGNNQKVQATGVWNDQQVWAVSAYYQGGFNIHTTSGTIEQYNSVSFTRKTVPLNKNFTIGE